VTNQQRATSLFHRTNLNLYTEDVEYMQRVYGRGWTEQARDIIHQELKAIKQRMELQSIEDFIGDTLDGVFEHDK
jgi:hypothetical protein